MRVNAHASANGNERFKVGDILGQKAVQPRTDFYDAVEVVNVVQCDVKRQRNVWVNMPAQKFPHSS